MQQLSDIGEAALAYAKKGWRVFPCHTPKDSGCSCGQDCGSVGKHPRTENGLTDATSDLDRVRIWWTHFPDANIGLATGQGIQVLDVDGEIGEDALFALTTEFGALPATAESRTGRGRHLFFAYPKHLGNTIGKLGAKLDTRGDGGYVLAPPSLHASGASYAWVSQPSQLAQLPDWLTKRIEKPVPLLEFVLRDHTRKFDQQYTLHKFYRSWFTNKLNALANCPPGDRNLRFYNLSCWAGTCVQAGLGEAAWLEDQVKQAARTAGLTEREIERTWESGYEDGWLVAPLTEPPELDEKGEKHVKPPKPAPFSNPDGLVITPLSAVKKEAVDFLWGNRLVQNGVNLLVGDGGLGKSAISLHLALSVTTGSSLPDDQGQGMIGDVMLVTYEDPASVVQQRASVLGVDPDRLFIIEGRKDHEGFVAAFSKDDVHSLNAALDAYPDVRLLIIDPWARYLDEADNKEHVIRAALAPLERLAQQRRVSVLLVAHINKNADYSSAEYRIAGHSGFKNAARSALMIGSVTDTEIAITHVKHNWSPPAPAILYSWDPDKKWRDGQSPLEWKGVVDLDADELFSQKRTSRVEIVTAWMKRLLLSGPMPIKEIKSEAEEEGFSDNVIHKAAGKLNVVTEPIPGTYDSSWRLP